jgi:hypothetical protein
MLERSAQILTLAFAALALAGPAAAQIPVTDPGGLVQELNRAPSVPGRVLRVEPDTGTALVSTAYGDVRVGVPVALRDTLRVGDTVDLQLVMSHAARVPQVGQGPTLPDGRAVYPGTDVRTSAPPPAVIVPPTSGEWVRVDPPGASTTPLVARPGCRQLERRVYENGQLMEQSVREVCP